MIYTANTGCFTHVQGSEDFFFASSLSESIVISIKVVVDSITVMITSSIHNDDFSYPLDDGLTAGR